MPRAKSHVTVLFKEIKGSKGPRMKYNFCCVDVAKLVFIAHNLELGKSENLPTERDDYAKTAKLKSPVTAPAPSPQSFSHDTSYDCCLLYTSDAADERSSVDLGGRRIIKKK